MDRTKTVIWGLFMSMLPLNMSCTTDKDKAGAQHGGATPAYSVLQDRADRLLVELPNRMIVAAQQLHMAPVVSVYSVVKTGSIYEQQASPGHGSGLSHFLEHLVSGGSTTNRTEAESTATLGRMGARTNASTSLDKVRYYINTTSEHTTTAVELMSDWLANCTIGQREYARERDVIQREFEMGRGDPRRIFWKLTQRARFTRHPARHPTIGYLDQFLKISRDDIYAFYKQMYAPNNIVFVVVGDINKQQVVDQVAALWADVPSRPLPEIRFPVEPRLDEPRHVRAAVDIKRPRIRLIWPGTQLAAPGDFELDVLAEILGKGEASRLVQVVRDQKRAVNRIDAYNSSFTWGPGMFGIDADIADIQPDPTKPLLSAEQAIEFSKEIIIDQIRRIRTEGITGEELARAKRQILADVVASGQTVHALAGQLGSDLAGMGDPDYTAHYAQKVQKMTADQVVAVAKQFLDPNRVSMITLVPLEPGQQQTPIERLFDEPIGSGELIQTINLDNAVIADQVRKNMTLVQDDVPAIDIDPIQKHVLPNGMRILIGRSTLVPVVAIELIQLGGLLGDEVGREGLTGAIGSMRRRGTTTRSAQGIAEEVDQLGATLSTSGRTNSSATQAFCFKEDLPRVMEIVGDVVLNPTFPAGEWKKMQPRLLAAIDRQTDRWYGELRHHFLPAFFGDSPMAYTSLGRREAVAQFTVEDLGQTYYETLVAEEMVLAVFGDIDPAQVLELAGRYFNSLPAKSAGRFEPKMPSVPTPNIIQAKTPKELAAVHIGFGPATTYRSEDYPVLEVLANVFDRFPSGWLTEQLRGEGEGLAYAVHSMQRSGLVPGYFEITFNANAQKVTDALGRTVSVVERAKNELVSDQTLADAKSAVLTSALLRRQSNRQRAQQAALDEIYGLGFDHTTRYMEQVNSVDAQLLQSVAQKYLTNPVIVVLTHLAYPPDELIMAAGSLIPPPSAD